MRTLTFLNTKPLSIFYDNCLPKQALEYGLKIYVPDESVEGYKNKMTLFADLILPMSQKE